MIREKSIKNEYLELVVFTVAYAKKDPNKKGQNIDTCLVCADAAMVCSPLIMYVPEAQRILMKPMSRLLTVLSRPFSI